MTAHGLDLGGARLEARASGTLWWAGQSLLVVSDLHLGKAQRLARRSGALLPPYETTATLARLQTEIAATNPRKVICLGDSFDDLTAVSELAPSDHATLTQLMARRDWLWIEGNHDPAPLALGGQHGESAVIAGLTFRHIANPAASGPEISGHYHPKARLAGQTAPCFLLNPPDGRLILPAFGAYTGGLDCAAPVLAALMPAPDALAILTGAKARAIPYSAASGSTSTGVVSNRPRASSRSR